MIKTIDDYLWIIHIFKYTFLNTHILIVLSESVSDSFDCLIWIILTIIFLEWKLICFALYIFILVAQFLVINQEENMLLIFKAPSNCQ